MHDARAPHGEQLEIENSLRTAQLLRERELRTRELGRYPRSSARNRCSCSVATAWADESGAIGATLGEAVLVFTRCDSQLAGGTEATSIAPIHVRIAEARKRGCLRGMYLHLVVTTELPQLQDRDGAASGYCPVSL